ncbi:MAG TPA: serine/threonine-protein kinase [Solirubrobacteraceae bacterium]
MERSGTVLAGRYRVVRHVGSGGMGVVYLAHDATLGRDVAVKSVHAEPESERGRRIMREARLGAGLRHPHLVTVFDVVPDGGALLLVTEYVEGQTLADALRGGALPVERALAVLRAVADALDHVHARGIVHRDVKPANVLLGSAGAVKLADLGIATADDVTQITQTGGTLGTVAYMAPEQFEPGPITGAADVYALAAVAFEVLAGQRPYPGATAFEVFARLREGAEPPDVRSLRPELPAAVNDALRRGMATDPEARPATAGALVSELAAALEPAKEPPGVDTEPLAARPSEPLDTAPLEAPPGTAPLEPPLDTALMPAAEPRGTPRRDAAARDRRSRQGRRLVPLAVLVLTAVVVAIVLASGGGDEEQPGGLTQARTSPARTTSTSAAKPPPARAAVGPATPVDAVRAFYSRAAEGDLEGAWRLAGPQMRAAFGNSFETFSGDLGSLRAITFRRLSQTETTGSTAVVALETIAEHTDRTEHCTGTVKTVRSPKGRWLVEPLGVRCA